VIDIHPFKNLGGCVYHGGKPGYSFPMLILWRIGKLLYLWIDVDETYCIALYGRNKFVYAKTAYFSFPHTLSPCL
jgi:hypothetical protein